MTYLDWPAESVAYYGPLGGLVPIPITNATGISEDSEGRWVTKTALSGEVVAQRLPRRRRKWRVDLPPLPHDDLAGVRGLVSARWQGQRCHWITPDMKNLVQPDWGAFEHPEMGGGIERLGPLVTDEAFLPGSAWLSNPGVITSVTNRIAVRPGQRYTCSAWLIPESSAVSLVVQFRDSTGGNVSQQAIPMASNGDMVRVSHTTDAPEGAATVEVRAWNARQIAGVQVERGALSDFSPGEGCPAAVFQESGIELDSVYGSDTWRSNYFVVQEVR